VHGDEFRIADEVGRADRLRAEAQVRDGQAARLLGVVHKVSLREERGVLADDLDRVLVGAHGTVAAKPVEEGARHAGEGQVEGGVVREGETGHVVADAHGEGLPQFVGGEHFKHGLHHAGLEFLAAEAVAPAGDADAPLRAPRECRDDIEVERLAARAGFLRAVQHRDRADGLWQRLHEASRGEGTVQADLHHTHAGSAPRKVLHGAANGLRAGAHADNDGLRLGMALVLEGFVVAARHFAELLESLLHDGDTAVVIGVAGLAALEEHIGVRGRSARGGMLRRKAARAEFRKVAGVDEALEFRVGKRLHLADFVRGAETVEEMEEGKTCRKRGRVRHGGHVLRLLNVGGGQHRDARLAAGHDIGVFREDGEGICCDRARGHVQDEGRELPGDAIEVRNHQEQALRGRESGDETAAHRRSVHRAGHAALALHLDHLGHQTLEVRLPGGGPCVAMFRHRGGRCDGVDGDQFAHPVGDGGHRLVRVHRMPVLQLRFCHGKSDSSNLH